MEGGVMTQLITNIIALTIGLFILYFLNGGDFDIAGLIVFIYLTQILTDIRRIKEGG